MGKKRQRNHEEDDETNSIAERLPRSHPTKRPRREAPFVPSSSSINHLKGKIRDVTRTLERSKKLPEDVRIEQERALAGYKADLIEAENEKRKKHMIKKYHMVRFFERQKATRKLKRLKNLASKAEPQSAELFDLREKIHRAQVDLNYTLYCPLNEKYTSLYKRTDGTGSADMAMSDSTPSTYENTAEIVKPPMWKVVEKCMEDGTLETLREGKLPNQLARDDVEGLAPANGRTSKAQSKSRSKKERNKKVREAVRDTENAESDEGFFEE
ncbi:MAG: hypothetical protein Q9191_004924 [Dirinaria sp. TL-2023a]